VPIPRQLNQILKKWISINPTNYLLFDTNFNPLSSVKLNQRLNKIFDEKKISVNILRHSFLTDKYKKHIEEQKKMDHDMQEMGSSNKQATLYVKN
jgi:integrase